ncbi:MAG: hypothetical protein SOU19_03135 [Candidatus Caccosoma sp.]|nr:hypothetical protein [Candidatus Caccosoma sp.]
MKYHPAIITTKEWELVQEKLEFRDSLPFRMRNDKVFSGRINY